MNKYIRLFSLVSVFLITCLGMTSLMAASKDEVSVSLHGVNYTDRPFQYIVIDPKDSNNSGGGEHIAPFSAGGIVCCFKLPKEWYPGLQVQIKATYWLSKDADGKLPEITKVHTVEVPKYVDGEAGELWVLRTKEGEVEVVSSNYQPNHPNWPGKIKYQRDRWSIQRRTAEVHVKNYTKLIHDLETSPLKHSEESWEYAKKYDKDEIAKFKGADDPAYLEYIRANYEKGLKRSEARLEELMKRKP
jgi:hypothetical protein